MIAVWMLYCLGIGVAFCVVGYACEWALHYAGRATRWAWVVALAGSFLVPAAAWVRPEAFATFRAPVAATIVEAPSAAAYSASPSITTETSNRSLSLSDFDAALRWGWETASVALILTLVVAATRLIKLRRQWRRTAIDGRQVFVSDDIGPAVVGFWSPRVVLPEWTLELPAHERELMFAHEEQHVRAADPALIAIGFGLLLVAPWNIALWWQWRRLRLAVEMDCDARVLDQGRSASAYGELLLRVGAHRSPRLLGVAAFGEPVSFLESRIRRMLGSVPRWRWAGVALALAVAIGALIGACETPRPVGPPSELTAQPESSTDVITGSAITLINGVVIAVIAPSHLDQTPKLLSGPILDVPRLTRLAGIEGRVFLRATIDTDGRPDSASITVMESPHPALSHSATRALLHSLFRPGRAGGRAVAAVVNVVFNFKIRRVADSMGVREAHRLRSWVERSAHKMLPSILEPNGPPMDAFLVADARLQVYRSALTTLHYLGANGARPTHAIDVAELKEVLPSFSPGHDSWGIADPRALEGLVRDNVRVIWIHHDPAAQDAVASSSGLSMPEMRREIGRAEQVRTIAHQYHPEMFGRGTAPTAIALVMDARGAVLGHAASTREARGADVRTVDGVHEDCLEVLTRLVPRFKDAQWSQTGCTNDPQPNVVIYWGIVLHP